MLLRSGGVFGVVGEFLGDLLAIERRLALGTFTLDLDTRQLLCEPARQPVPLSPKAYELLCVLVEARPRAVAKNELHERLWPSSFVSEATLASLVADLRVALGERGRGARFIRTVHGFGYAFAAEARNSVKPDLARSATWIIFNGREQALGEGEHVIGRDGNVAVTLRAPSVSRRHAKIVIAGDAATIEDLGSKNGTYLCGVPVRSRLALTDRDRIRIGRFELTYRSITESASTDTAT